MCVHYSISHNYARSAEASLQALQQCAAQLAALDRCTMLLVSGSSKRRLDSHTALLLLTASPSLGALLGQLPKLPPLAVAFNPYFPDEQRQAEERQRLRGKLEAGRGRVTAIYLQAGSDSERLADGLQFLSQMLDGLGQQHEQEEGGKQQQRPQHGKEAVDKEQQAQPAEQAQQARPAKRARQAFVASGTSSAPAATPAVPAAPAAEAGQQLAVLPAGSSVTHLPPLPARPTVYGSLMLPSKRFLAQMRFRPWAGVFLSEEYLGSVEAAEAATLRVLRVYAQHSVVPLVETEVASEAELERVRSLLAAAQRA